MGVVGDARGCEVFFRIGRVYFRAEIQRAGRAKERADEFDPPAGACKKKPHCPATPAQPEHFDCSTHCRSIAALLALVIII